MRFSCSVKHHVLQTARVRLYHVDGRVGGRNDAPTDVPHLDVDPVRVAGGDVDVEGARHVLLTGELVVLLGYFQALVAEGAVAGHARVAWRALVALVEEAVVGGGAALQALVAAARVVPAEALHAGARVAVLRVSVTRTLPAL